MKLEIGKRIVGDGAPVFVIAEMSANHLQKYNIAEKMVLAAKAAGADAIKLQTYTPDTMTIDSDKDDFMIKGTIWDGKKLYDLYKTAYTPWKWHSDLKNTAEKNGLIFFSTPFDKSAVDFLEDLGTDVYKIASFEMTDIPLIEYIASKGKPIIMSNGKVDQAGLDEAVHACKKYGNEQIAILKCTSAYPARPEDMNLLTIPDIKKRYGCVVGLSDHSGKISVHIASVALGAKIVEAHLILDRNMGGPDAKFSLEPDEFKEMVKNIREVEKSLGRVEYDPPRTVSSGPDFSRSLYVVEDMRKGDEFTEKNVRSIRPGYGMSPKKLPDIIGKKASRDIERGTRMDPELID